MPRIRPTYILLFVGLLWYSTSILKSKSANSFEILHPKPNRKADAAQYQTQTYRQEALEGQEVVVGLEDANNSPQKDGLEPAPDDVVESIERLRAAIFNADELRGNQVADPVEELFANFPSITSSVASPTPIVYTEADWLTHYSPLLTNPSPYGNDLLPNRTLANAAIVILCRNSELQPLRRTIREFEDRFNRKFGYPYVLLNDVPFTQEFKEVISNITRANTTFGLIPKEMWSWPSWIEQNTALRYMQRLETQNVMYGGSLSYRHMCRFNSGFFYKHPLLQGYDWYWRVEPGVNFYCDLDYDPFLWMQKNNKRYGFNIILHEIRETIPSLYEHTLKYAEAANLSTRLLRFFGDPSAGWKGYNLCHFWSNFEIADMGLWRNPVYQKYFDYLDSTGNFYYERWGDAPVHTLALALMLNKSEIHFFNDIGYKHDIFAHCVDGEASGLSRKCMCPTDMSNFDWDPDGSCLKEWLTYPMEGYRWDFLPNKTIIWDDPKNPDQENDDSSSNDGSSNGGSSNDGSSNYGSSNDGASNTGPENDYPGFEVKSWIEQEIPVQPGMGEGRKVVKIPEVVWQVVKRGKLDAVPENIRAVWQARGWLAHLWREE